MIHYGITKTAQLSVSHGFAMELAGTGVTVNALLPGPTHTENSDRMWAERARAAGKTVAEIEADFIANFDPALLVRRFTTADEVAALRSTSAARWRLEPLVRRCGSMAAWSTRSCEMTFPGPRPAPARR